MFILGEALVRHSPSLLVTSRGSLFDMIHQHLVSRNSLGLSIACCNHDASRPYKLRWHGELTVALSLSLGSLQLHRNERD